MDTDRRRRIRAAPIVLGAARLALGILWLEEGITKYRAGFGAADIGFIVSNAAQNPRIPGYFALFGSQVMAPLEPLFGVGIPLLETALGVLLVLGILTRPAAIVSIGTLLLYWSSDQLITQYPVMAALSVAVLAASGAAGRLGLTSMLLRVRPVRPALRPWL
ncbi:DoxX family membrane protein [Microbacterium sp. SORGH_AS_0888]|uniref:DoxX family membrane protein n=1 Tax=Microbacterium sp. SORGH_AS_0888 TaxID=3041791 RepID=UPI00277E1B56|nr:DoxX family membrane protein [Microbacterium sp. SORGH_AS_0888]MDQ1130036.1 thiosulfate dehydrogenase [quinone] large subunit [Microbacterium sp. SORGH_AS_0888]